MDGVVNCSLGNIFLRKGCMIKLYVIFLPIFQRVQHLIDFSWTPFKWQYLNGSWVFRKFDPVYTYILPSQQEILFSFSSLFMGNLVQFFIVQFLWQMWFWLFVSNFNSASVLLLSPVSLSTGKLTFESMRTCSPRCIKCWGWRIEHACYSSINLEWLNWLKVNWLYFVLESGLDLCISQ